MCDLHRVTSTPAVAGSVATLGATGDARYRIAVPPHRGRIWVCDNL